MKIKGTHFTVIEDNEIAAAKTEEVLALLDGLTVNQIHLTLDRAKRYVEISIPLKFEII